MVMGILNCTPDSFSDGGAHPDPVAAGRAMIAAGADILDVGGESTRPGAEPVPPEVECTRIAPVIAALRDEGVPISVDTRNAAVMAVAVEAGASIVNDVSGLTHDPDAAALVARLGVAVVIMHMRGTPQTMQDHARYRDVAGDVVAELAQRIAAAEAAGIARGRIIIDPGLGFAKTALQSVELLRRLPELRVLGCPILVGASRKGFIGTVAGEADPRRRLPGSLATHLFALQQGAAMLRVHDVAETVQAVKMWRALAGSR